MAEVYGSKLSIYVLWYQETFLWLDAIEELTDVQKQRLNYVCVCSHMCMHREINI